jgi:hypothetical protein
MMKTDKQKHNWLVDATLFAGFLVAMLLDLTGLTAHQWLGVAVTALAGYHLLAHEQWVVSVTQRFFGRTSRQARRSFLVDAGLLIGFAAIGFTGLVISTWLNLTLVDFMAWRAAHVIASVVTLGLVVLKIGAHWRWIVTVAGRRLIPRPSGTSAILAAQPARIGRREFVRLMSFVGVTALFAGANALRGDGTGAPDASVASAETSAVTDERTSAQAAVAITPTAVPGPTRVLTDGFNRPPATVAQTSGASAKTNSASATTNTTGACVVRCSKRCAYPGRCRRYVDTNGNKRCDLGECGV